MACWVGEADGVVEDVGEAVELLGVGGVWHNGVGAGKAAEAGHIIPRIHID